MNCTLYQLHNFTISPQVQSFTDCNGNICSVTVNVNSNYFITADSTSFTANPSLTIESFNIDRAFSFSSCCSNDVFHILGKYGQTFNVGDLGRSICVTEITNISDCSINTTLDENCYTFVSIDANYANALGNQVYLQYTSAFINCNSCFASCLPCATTTTTTTVAPTTTTTTTIAPTTTTTTTVEPTCIITGISDCSIITLFQMEVQCLVSHPTEPNSTDGVASLLITGGTPPYVITWSNGSIGPVIYNLSAGSYGATVVDYYGDFTANTTCILTGVTPTTTTTSTTTTSPFPTEYDLCLTTSVLMGGFYIENQTQFNPDVIYNGKPSWISDDGEQSIIWNSTYSQWEVSASTPTLYIITNLNPTYPPIYGGWTILGARDSSVIVNEGLCGSAPINSRFRVGNGTTPLTVNVTKNQTICGCDGGMTISANGGTPPYTYSIDAGLTYKNMPIFNNLCSGTYSVLVADDGGIINSSSIVLNSPSKPTTYSVGLTTVSKIINTSNNTVTTQSITNVTVSPSLPDGVSLTFDISHLNISKSSPSPNSSTSQSNSELLINEQGITGNTSNSDSQSSSIVPGCQSNNVYITSFTEQWSQLNIVNTDSLILTTITSVTKNESVNCYVGTSEEKYSITNLKLSGCNCCSVITT